jgi:hypothetical protein
MDTIGLIGCTIPLIMYIAGGIYSHKQNKKKG